MIAPALCTSVIQFEDRNHHKQLCGVELKALNGALVCPVCEHRIRLDSYCSQCRSS